MDEDISFRYFIKIIGINYCGEVCTMDIRHHFKMMKRFNGDRVDWVQVMNQYARHFEKIIDFCVTEEKFASSTKVECDWRNPESQERYYEFKPNLCAEIE